MPQTLRRSIAALRATLLGAALLVTGPLALLTGTEAEAAQFETWLHGSSLMGDPKYPQGFPHFDYVNVDAPKGGTARLAAQGGFDSFNAILPKGEAAAGMGLIYDTLMTSSYDEISSDYGLIAEAMYIGPDYSFVKYRLREGAKWHDGTPISVEDVVWSFEKLTELNPQQRFYYSHVTKAEITGEREVTFHFDQKDNRELPHIVGQLLILPKHWWTGKDAKGNQRDISRGTLEPPLGSGAYRIKSFSAGKFVEFERVEDYWAKDLNVNIGANNFDVIRQEYFRDATVMLEAFKSDLYDFRRENVARQWALSYDFPAARDGRVVKEMFDDKASGLTTGFFVNMRREKFSDARVREALNYAFNFEEMNRTLFFDQYERVDSFFFGTELAASGLPEGKELAILEELKDKVPPRVFTEPYKNPVYADRKDLRNNLRKALELFKEAGWEPVGSVMQNKAGEAFEIEYLTHGTTSERIALRLQASLQRIGVKLTVRVVDTAQYVNRLRARDFDLAYLLWAQSLSPGNEQRDYFSSDAADRDASRNYGGIKDEAVDALIEKVIFAEDRETLVAATRALDRVLLANHYIIPNWTLTADRTARWDRFGRPEELPLLTYGFPTIWWWDKEKAAAVDAKN